MNAPEGRHLQSPGTRSGRRGARQQPRIAYETNLGRSLIGKSEELLISRSLSTGKGTVQLLFTSPPFPLNRKKKYGNQKADAYKTWLTSYAKLFCNLLRPDGSIVIELGNAWEPGQPVMSTLAIEALLAFKSAAQLYLCQEFVWYNPAKLPTPAQWVTIERIRVKDSFTRLWWLSRKPNPKADNRRVLVPYSKSMQALLKSKTYNAGKRPSGHTISETSFLADHGGAIPPNVIIPDHQYPESVIVDSNTLSTDPYHIYCRLQSLAPHPARMPSSVAEFFIRLCTEPGDLVLDPFAGSNTTGAAAEELGRRWIAIEADESYALAGKGRFPALWPTMSV